MCRCWVLRPPACLTSCELWYAVASRKAASRIATSGSLAAKPLLGSACTAIALPPSQRSCQPGEGGAASCSTARAYAMMAAAPVSPHCTGVLALDQVKVAASVCKARLSSRLAVRGVRRGIRYQVRSRGEEGRKRRICVSLPCVFSMHPTCYLFSPGTQRGLRPPEGAGQEQNWAAVEQHNMLCCNRHWCSYLCTCGAGTMRAFKRP